MSGGPRRLWRARSRTRCRNLQRYVAGNLAGWRGPPVRLPRRPGRPGDAGGPGVPRGAPARHVRASPTTTLVDRQAARAAQHPPADQRQRRQGPAEHGRLGRLGLPRRRRRDRRSSTGRCSTPCRRRPGRSSLAPLEAVSRKQLGRRPDLVQAAARHRRPDAAARRSASVDRPSNGAYFHGHVDGKSGIRPTPDLWLTLHHVVDAEQERASSLRHRLPACGCCTTSRSRARSSSASGPRSWRPGPMPNFRPAREPTAVALRTLIGKGLTAEQAAPYLMRIFERTTEDDFETLRDLGLLGRGRLREPAPTCPSRSRPALAGRCTPAGAPQPVSPSAPSTPASPVGPVQKMLTARRLGQREASCAASGRPAVLERLARHRIALDLVRPGRRRAGCVDRAVAVAQHREQPAAALPVGAGPGLRLRGRPVVRRVAGRPPRAQVGDRAVARSAGSAAVQTRAPSSITATDQVAAVGSSSGSRSAASVALGRGHRGGRELHAGDHAGEDPAHVGVQHDVPPAVGEGRDRGGGVVADAGQGAQVVVRPPAPRRRAARRSRRRRRAGAAPGAGSRAGPRPDRLAGRLGGQRRRRRPALQPGSWTGSTRATGVCWSMNSETITDHARRRRPPGQVARVLVVPARGRVRGGRSSWPPMLGSGAIAARTVSHLPAGRPSWLALRACAVPDPRPAAGARLLDPADARARHRPAAGLRDRAGCSAAAATPPRHRPDAAQVAARPSTRLGDEHHADAPRPTPEAAARPGKGKTSRRARAGRSPTARARDEDIAVEPRRSGSRSPAGRQRSSCSCARSSAEACTWRVSHDSLAVKITSGKDEIWSSRECPRAIPRSTSWSARRSAERRGHLERSALRRHLLPARPTGRCRATTTWSRRRWPASPPTCSSSWTRRRRQRPITRITLARAAARPATAAATTEAAAVARLPSRPSCPTTDCT